MRHTASTKFMFAGASILTLTGLMAATPVQAATAGSTDTLQHFIECAGWLLSDPGKHAQFCDPGTIVFAHGSGGSGTPDSEYPG